MSGLPGPSEQQRVLHSPFDIETHKATFVNYLEVCIDPEGTVHYAVPSHQKWLMGRYMDEKGYDSEERAWEDFPVADFGIGCLARLVGCVAVWSDWHVGKPNARQRLALRRLKEAGLYEGALGAKGD